MPIDPRIALGVRPGPQPIMPSELEQKRLTLADLGRRERLDEQQAQMNDMRIADDQQQQAERQSAVERAGKVREIYARHLKPGEDERTVLKKALPEIWGVDPDAAGKIDARIYELDKREYEANERELKVASDRAGLMGKLAGAALAAKTSEAVRRALGAAVAQKLITAEEAAQAPTEWSDATATWLKQYADGSLSYKEQIDAARNAQADKWNAEEQARKAANEKRLQEMHDATLPSKKADPKTGLTPMQAATVEGQKAARGETARHNKVMEAKGAGGEDDTGKQARTAIAKLDTEAKGLQGKIDTRESAKGKLRSLKTQLETEIASLEKDKPKGWEEKAAKARAKWQGNEAQLRELEGQQQELVKRKDDVYGQIRAIKGGGSTSAQTQAKPTAPASPRRAQNPQTGEIVEWNGTQWVKVN